MEKPKWKEKEREVVEVMNPLTFTDDGTQWLEQN